MGSNRQEIDRVKKEILDFLKIINTFKYNWSTLWDLSVYSHQDAFRDTIEAMDELIKEGMIIEIPVELGQQREFKFKEVE